MNLVRKIQSSTSDPNFHLSDILRQCKILANKLKYEPLRIWTENELNGYPSNDALPEYRVIKNTQFKGDFTNGYYFYKNMIFRPSLPEDMADISDSIYTISFPQGVSALEKLTCANEDVLKLPLPINIAVTLGKFTKDIDASYYCVSASKIISVSSLVNILDTIKTKILDFTLEIESQYPDLGDNETDQQPVQKSTLDTIFYSIIFNYNNKSEETSYNGNGYSVTKEENMSSKYDQRGANFPGGFAETNYGKMVENQFNLQAQDLSEAVSKIQQLLTQLQTQEGYSMEDAQTKIATDIAVQAKTDPNFRNKLVSWVKSLGDPATKAMITEAVKEIFKIALS